jgi:glycosyltransferase involved in cell wall biosynthesis
MVSLIVLTHNRARLLEQCVRSLLQQDWPSEDYEIIVADDGSTDGTAESLKRLASSHPNLYYLRQPHKGVAAARNLGLVAARGEILSFLADDYELAPDYVRTVVRLMNQDTSEMVIRFKVVAAGTDLSSRVIDFYYSLGTVKRLVPLMPEVSPRWGRWNRFRAIARYIEQPTTHHDMEAAGGAAFRRKVFEVVGIFDESLVRCEDSDMGTRLREHNIGIYYYPFHQIRHHYERFPGEALRKSFRTGMNRYRYHRKHRFRDGPTTMSFIAMGVEKAVTSVGAFIYCGRRGRLHELLLYFPCLLLLEGANKLGYLTAMLGRGPDVSAPLQDNK